MGLVRRGFVVAQGRDGWTRAGLIGTVLVFLVAAACIRLGVWQLDRLEQRRAINALAAARMHQPPVLVDDLPADSAGAAWRRLVLRGSCEGGPIVLAARSRHGAPGAHLLCRFRTDGGRIVLLDRGWVHSADARTVAPELLAHAVRDTIFDALAVPFPPGEATTGATGDEAALELDDDGVRMADPAPRVIYRLNRKQARAVVGAPLPAWYAQALGPDGVVPAPSPLPDLSEGPHLGYAVQWFSFAAIGLIGWLVLAVRRRPSAPAAAPPF
ncbi:MAG TPA: SURF1 family protein [Longimicrobiales bacterium]